MIITFTSALLIWLACGVSIWALFMYVYFRGPKDAIMWMTRIAREVKADKGGKEIARNVEVISPHLFNAAACFVSCIFGPISVLVGLKSMFGISRDIKKLKES